MLPTPEKIWQFSVNVPLRSTGSDVGDQRRFLRLTKDALAGFASNPWVVRYSCDGVTAGAPGDGVDRWTSDGALLFGPGPQSWIVLAQSGISANFQLLIALVGTSFAVVTAFSASAGFTGGTTTARPTATDEVVLNGGAAGGARAHGFGAATFSCALHVMQSTDGQCTRVVAHDAVTAAVGMTVLLDRAKAPVTGWATPFAALWAGAGAISPAFTLDALHAQPSLRGSHGVEVLRLYASCSGFAGAAAARQLDANDLSGEAALFPIGLVGFEAGVAGRHGGLYDAWWIGTHFPTGFSLPDAASRLFCKLTGDLALPWDGSSPVVHL